MLEDIFSNQRTAELAKIMGNGDELRPLPGTRAAHALLDRLADHVRLFLSQNACLHRLVQIAVQRSRTASRLVGRTHLVEGRLDLGLVDALSDSILILAPPAQPDRGC